MPSRSGTNTDTMRAPKFVTHTSIPLLLFKTNRAVESPCCVTDKNAFGSSPDSVRCSSDCEHDSKITLAKSKKGLVFIFRTIIN